MLIIANSQRRHWQSNLIALRVSELAANKHCCERSKQSSLIACMGHLPVSSPSNVCLLSIFIVLHATMSYFIVISFFYEDCTEGLAAVYFPVAVQYLQALRAYTSLGISKHSQCRILSHHTIATNTTLKTMPV